jgi:hypothetical protein
MSVSQHICSSFIYYVCFYSFISIFNSTLFLFCFFLYVFVAFILSRHCSADLRAGPHCAVVIIQSASSTDPQPSGFNFRKHFIMKIQITVASLLILLPNCKRFYIASLLDIQQGSLDGKQAHAKE